MTRDEAYVLCLKEIKQCDCLGLELITGFGKTKMAIDLVNTELDKLPIGRSILLLVAKKVHKQTWKEEILKWGGFHNSPKVTEECYESLKKHTGETFDIIICDEAHHLNSELRRDLISTISHTHKILLLSATFPKEFRKWLIYKYHCHFITASLKEAIKDDVLPEPEILLFPLTLDNERQSEWVELNPKVHGPILIGDYKNLWKYKHSKSHVKLRATPKQKAQWFNNEVLHKKNYYNKTRFAGAKLQWLKMCSERLHYFARCKDNIVNELLYRLKDKRTLTFCASIEQTEVLGKHCIHSKNKEAQNVLEQFNHKEINHITACQVLNEGVNLQDCQYGIFANINASEIIQKQRQGRLLRHKHPVIIIPYYKDTREEEIVENMLETYDKKNIRILTDINKLL